MQQHFGRGGDREAGASAVNTAASLGAWGGWGGVQCSAVALAGALSASF